MHDHPKPGWGQWFAAQLGLFAAVGIVAGFGLWLAREAPIVGIVVGCSAFVIGGLIGVMRLERWLAAADASNQDA
jgi:hypothetical protein